MSHVATAAVADGHMEPVAPAPITQQVVVTGQYLYENFMQSNESDKTRMGLIRQLSDIADALQIKGACDKMVELAVLADYPTGKPKKADRKSKEQQAMNVRTIIQQSWGALHFARPITEELGYDDTTGYLAMSVLAKKALTVAKIDWKGEALKTDADKERARLQKEQGGETKALQDVQKANPRLVNESLGDWNTRTFALAQIAMADAREETETKIVDDVVKKLCEKHGDDRLYAIAEAILSKLGIEIASSSEEEETELSDEEVAARMSEVSEEQAAH